MAFKTERERERERERGSLSLVNNGLVDVSTGCLHLPDTSSAEPSYAWLLVHVFQHAALNVVG